MTKYFTLQELKRLKYTKMQSGLSESQARKEIQNLIDEVEKNMSKKKTGRPTKEDIDKKFKEGFEKLRHTQLCMF